MNYRDELVALIMNGTAAAEIYSYFRLEKHLSRAAIMELLHDTGVSIPLPPTEEEISDQRRRELQELSLT
jgi:hypothetical protein